jgi:hypothetical protein
MEWISQYGRPKVKATQPDQQAAGGVLQYAGGGTSDLPESRHIRVSRVLFLMPRSVLPQIGAAVSLGQSGTSVKM